jgi:hypothetical protein
MLCSMMIGLHLTSTWRLYTRMHDVANDTYMNVGKMNLYVYKFYMSSLHSLLQTCIPFV